MLAIALCVAVLLPAFGRAQSLPALEQLADRAEVSALVVRLSDMRTLAKLNPQQRLTPASTSKLFTAAAALEYLGPTHRFVTRLATNGARAGSTVNGDLVLVGAGDPMLDEDRLQRLARRLRAAGITRVAGDLIVDQSLFGAVGCATPDRCAAQQRSGHAYDAPVSAAGINFATLHATVFPGLSAGRPTRAVLHPRGLPGTAIDNRSQTAAAGSHPHLRAWRTTRDARSVLHIRGELPAGGKAIEIRRSVADAATYTARAMAVVLARNGVHVTGIRRVRNVADAAGRTTLVRVASDTLAQQLIPMLAYSNNYMADTLTLDVAAAAGSQRPLRLARAASTLEILANKALTSQYRIAADAPGPTLKSGSGLTTGSEVSALDLVSLLAYMYRSEALFPAFYGALPVPKSSPHRALKGGNAAFLNRLTAKTGTLTEPVGVRAVAGYLRLGNGGFAAYAVLINATDDDPRLTHNESIGAYESDLEAILAQR